MQVAPLMPYMMPIGLLLHTKTLVLTLFQGSNFDVRSRVASRKQASEGGNVMILSESYLSCILVMIL